MPWVVSRRGGVVVPIVLSGLAWASLGEAQKQDAPAISASPRLRLEWVAPADCVPAPAIIRRAEEIAGDAPAGLPVEARGAIERDGTSWFLTLTLLVDGQPRERSVKGASCDELAQVAALVLAIAINPGAALHDTSPSLAASSREPLHVVAPEPEARFLAFSPPSPPAFVIVSVEPSAPATVSRTRPRLVIGAGPGFTTNIAGRPAIGVMGWQGVAVGQAQLWIQEGYQPAVTVGSGDTSGYGEFTLGVVGIRACWEPWQRGRIAVAGCVGGDLGFLRGVGHGVVNEEEATRNWSAAALGPRVRVQVSRLIGTRFGLDGLMSFARPGFLLDEKLLHRPDRFAVSAFVGFDLRFW